tara:strand:+ start:435 stop:1190 length:756 start_codon:yes stop_codon:yes gene_type:complete
MRDYLKEFSGDVIGDFLVENDIGKILKEGTAGTDAPTDDGPPTFYKSLGQYKQESEDWIKQLQNDLGYKVINYILGDGAMDPEEDYTMSYRATNPISHGEVKKYKKTLRQVMDTLGWKVVTWMGVDKDQQMAGPPVASGVDAQGRKEDNEMRTNQAAKKSGKKFSSGKKRPRLHVEKYQPLTKDWWDDTVRKELLLEGGAYGHMAHPFDDKDLTFKDLKNIIDMGLGGQLNREDNVTEKLDGQNLMISWRA